MTTIKLDSITFRLKEAHDFSWLKKYGKAFWCVDETGSGCICIGMENADKKYFFAPCSYGNWQLNEESYKIAVKAVSADRSQRYKAFEEFFDDWKKAKAQIYF